jgi:hypothetical protein
LPSENPDEEGALGLPPLPAPPPRIPEAPTRLEQTKVPLAWTAAKVGPAVNISGDGATASRSASGCGAQLTSEWMQGGRHPHVYHIVLALDEVMPETMIGIVGKNFWPSDWSEPLAKSLHSIVLECGTGKFFVKGKATSFMLKPLTSGARLHMMLRRRRPQCEPVAWILALADAVDALHRQMPAKIKPTWKLWRRRFPEDPEHLHRLSEYGLDSGGIPEPDPDTPLDGHPFPAPPAPGIEVQFHRPRGPAGRGRLPNRSRIGHPTPHPSEGRLRG